MNVPLLEAAFVVPIGIASGIALLYVTNAVDYVATRAAVGPVRRRRACRSFGV